MKRSGSSMTFALAHLVAMGLLSGGLMSCSPSPTYEAQLHAGDGLKSGTPVFISGVEAGQITEVRLVDNRVQVNFTISPPHQVELREDACALAVDDGEEAALVVWPGESTASLSGPVPACELDDIFQFEDIPRWLGEQMGDAAQSFIEGLRRSFRQ